MKIETADTCLVDLNLCLRERVDPLLALLTKLAPPTLSHDFHLALQLVILSFGSYLLLRFLNVDLKRAFSGALLTLLVIVYAVGPTSSYLNVYWFPYLVVSLVGVLSTRRLVYVVATFLTLLLTIISGGALAPFLVLLAISVAPALVDFSRSGRLSTTNGLSPFGTICITALIVSSFSVPIYPMPDYPPGARLTPVSELFLYSAPPLIGPYLDPNPLLYDSYQTRLAQSLQQIIVIMLSLLIGVILFARSRLSTLYKPLLALAFVALILYLEWSARGPIFAYQPFQTFRRIVPGISLVPLPWMLLPALLLVVNLFIIRHSNIGVIVFALSAILCTAAFTLPPKELQLPTTAANRAVSPSLFVIKSEGTWVADAVEISKHEAKHLRELAHGQDFIWAPSATVNEADVLFAVDRSMSTRWGTRRPQRPGDAFLLKFDRTLELLRVILDLGQSPTDFPRGLTVEGSLDGASYFSILEAADWHGPLRWSPHGYPYYGPQHDITLDFRETQRVNILRFTQTARDTTYDWSIADIRIFSPIKDLTVNGDKRKS